MARGSTCSSSAWTYRTSSRPFVEIYWDVVSKFKKWKRGLGIYLAQWYSTCLAFQRSLSQSPVLKKGEQIQIEKVPSWAAEQNLFSDPKRHSVWGWRKDLRQLFPACFLSYKSAGVCQGQEVQIVGPREHYLFFDPRNAMWVDLKVCLFFKGLISSLRMWVK